MPGPGLRVGGTASKPDSVPALMGQPRDQGGEGRYRKENHELPHLWQLIRCRKNVILGEHTRRAFNLGVEVREDFLEKVCATQNHFLALCFLSVEHAFPLWLPS